MYWTDVISNVIYQADLNGTNILSIISTGISDPGLFFITSVYLFCEVAISVCDSIM